MGEQVNLPGRYSADLVFPPWDGVLPRALPRGMVIAAPEGCGSDRHGG